MAKKENQEPQFFSKSKKKGKVLKDWNCNRRKVINRIFCHKLD